MSITLKLSMTNTFCPYVQSIRACTAVDLTRQIADAIEAFARNRGVATCSVDYEIVRHRR